MDKIEYMQAALKLAAEGEGSVEPNPMVGCLIIKDNQIIGKGYHERFGSAHAEINALADCKEMGNDPADATMYVTLEPCCHQGKTGPCTAAVISSKVAKVIIAAADPSPHVAGKGIELLKEAGITVEVSICEKDARQLNPAFYKFAETAKPWVILKWAQSEDGYLAYKDTAKHGQWISNEASRRDANNHRKTVQAILVGVNTVRHDDPQLTIRPDNKRQPLRIVLDSNLTIPTNAKILNTEIAETLIVTTQKANPEKVKEIESKGVQVLAVKETDGKCDLKDLLTELGKRKIQQLLVEGGPTVLDGFLTENLADAVRIYKATKTLANQGAAKISNQIAEAIQSNLTDTKSKDIEGDTRITGLLA